MRLVSLPFIRAITLAVLLNGTAGVCVYTVTIDSSRTNNWRFGGYQRNPYVQVRELGEGFLAYSTYGLFLCCWAALIGGVLLLLSKNFALLILNWQARIAIVINAVFFFFTAIACYAWVSRYGRPVQLPLTLSLRGASIAFDLFVWIFLSRQDVQKLLFNQSAGMARGFSVIVKQ